MQAKEQHRRLRAATFPHLPEELWLDIARSMSTKEWAKVSGTCMAWHQLQPQTIACRIDQVSVVKWLFSHCRSAVHLQICTPGDSNIVLQPPLVTQPLGSLRWLQLDISQTSYAWLRWQRHLLDKATQLERLEMKVYPYLDLPPMAALKHLELFYSAESFQLRGSISSLVNLDTLALRGIESEVAEPLDLQSSGSVVALPARLKSLSIWGRCTSRLHAPKGCAVHLHCRGCTALWMVEWWSEQTRLQLKGLHILSRAIYDRTGSSDWQLDDILKYPQSLETLRVIAAAPRLEQQADASNDVSQCYGFQFHVNRWPPLQNLTSLAMRAVNLWVVVPEAMPRRRLYLRAYKSLQVSFVDAEKSATGVECVKIQGATIGTVAGYAENGLGEFAAAMSARGAQLRAFECAGIHAEQSRGMCYQYGKGHGWEDECHCKVCSRCIGQSDWNMLSG